MNYCYLFVLLFLFFACSNKKETPYVKTLNNPFFDQAYIYLEDGKSDSAFLFFEKAKQLFLEQKDSLGVGNCLVNMAIVQQERNDYFGAQETALSALNYLKAQDTSHRVYLSSNYNNLGRATRELKEYPKAIQFFKQAIRFADDSAHIRIYTNNIGLVYHDMEDFPSAIAAFKEALKGEEVGTNAYARVLTNLSKAMWLDDPGYNASNDLRRALTMRIENKDFWGQNSSYATLSDYYSQTKPDSASYYAQLQYNTAKKNKSADDQVKALQRLIRLQSVDSTKVHFETYHRLSDSMQQVRAAAKNQFALIRYEVEKNITDNLRLEKENAEKATRLIRQRIVSMGFGVLLVLVVTGGILYYKKRKERLKQDALNNIKANQLKTSRKVHDVVANGIYRVMTEIEHKEELDREGILDKLEDMYHKSRDISYEAEGEDLSQKPFNEQVTDLLKSFASGSHRVLIAGNESTVWQAVASNVKEEIRHVLQELMVNMKKHSEANSVVVRFQRTDDCLKIHYQDTGIGLPDDVVYGNGLTSTGNRIKNMRGAITFASEGGKGLRVEVAIPLR
ncbi:Histidine kinase-, DNA gyrase B-, and HSP90-like ATPase [Sphingobacterium psychroaquaticum]|uniref:Histidine kinase-, DNA gyrase B-, and HSP90-like ATPase n=1 Tax=Sphingobacterium psychroaquaticum TaxID=561061 RepID=A0A1X7KTA6_9SPHI|nr:Histidine kinase-, DNA gyrase B-, and HSP90-like ATPase [Sphingobacterium psychroaquaticum]